MKLERLDGAPFPRKIPHCNLPELVTGGVGVVVGGGEELGGVDVAGVVVAVGGVVVPVPPVFFLFVVVLDELEDVVVLVFMFAALVGVVTVVVDVGDTVVPAITGDGSGVVIGVCCTNTLAEDVAVVDC